MAPIRSTLLRWRTRSAFVVCLCYLFCIASLNLSATEDQSHAATTNSPVELFKSFISSPPLIKELIFDEKIMVEGKTLSATQGLEFSTNFQGYIARWQPNAWSVYQVFAYPWLTNRLMNSFSMSAFDQKRWHISPNGSVIFWEDADDIIKSGMRTKEDPIVLRHKAEQISLDYLSYRLAEVMNMGVFGLNIGSIRWQGNSFCATNSKHSVAMDGMLYVSDVGFPLKLKLHTRTDTNAYDFSVLYFFERDTGLSFLPSQIRRIYHGNKTVAPEHQFVEIKSIVLAPELSHDVAFFPATNLLMVPPIVRSYINGAYFMTNSKGELYQSNLDLAPQANVNQQRTVYLAVCGVVSLIIFVLLVRTKTKP